MFSQMEKKWRKLSKMILGSSQVMKHSREKNVDHNSWGFSFSFFGTEWFSFSQEEEKVKNLCSTPSEKKFFRRIFFHKWKCFLGEKQKKTFFFPLKKYFCINQSKKIFPGEFFFTLWNQLNKCFFQENYLFFVFKSEQKEVWDKKNGKLCIIYFFRIL